MGTGKKMNMDVLLRGISMLVEFAGFSSQTWSEFPREAALHDG